MTDAGKEAAVVASDADAMRAGRAILDAHGQWEIENNREGGQNPWQRGHCMLLGRAGLSTQRAASSDAAQGVGDAMARFETLAEFLLGEGPMQGRQFGEPGPTTDDGKWRRNYWWRDEVRSVRAELRAVLGQAADGESATGGDDEPQARNAQRLPQGVREAVERLTKFAADWPAWMWVDATNDDLRTVLSALQAAPSEGGEPVAWQCRLGPRGDWYPLSERYVEMRRSEGYEVRPLFARPPAPSEEPLVGCWKSASKSLAHLAADERDRCIALSGLLARSREYVSDSLEAHEHSDGRELLAEIDDALSQNNNSKLGGDEPKANAPSILLPDDLLSLSEAATQGEWEASTRYLGTVAKGNGFIAEFRHFPVNPAPSMAATNAKLAAASVNFIRTLAAKQGGKS